VDPMYEQKHPTLCGPMSMCDGFSQWTKQSFTFYLFIFI